MKIHKLFPIVLLLSLVLFACSPISPPEITYAPNDLRFSGEQAFAIEEEFVNRFTNRHSGTEQNRLAVDWIKDRFESAGLTCQIDQWEVINYSVTVPLRNVVCKLPSDNVGEPREILVFAHHDQASTTIQGADNDGSGITILLHLAEIFAQENDLTYSLIFVATDAEEYGMIGSRRFIETYPNAENIIAGMSLDNLGRDYYDRMNMELVGQFSGYGPIWLALTARAAADAGDGLWQVNLRAPLDQVLDQAVPVSFMDQGPLVDVGVPALGFAGGYPSQYSDIHYRLWHDPDDTMEYQSPGGLEGSGRVVEALIRQLQSMNSFPEESGPYLYFDNSQKVLRGLPLYLIFFGFVSIFFIGSYFIGGKNFKEKTKQWSGGLIHFLGLWLPMVATILYLYLLVDVGIFKDYHVYPATTKDPELLNPDWLAVTLFILGLSIFIVIGRRFSGRYLQAYEPLDYKPMKSLAFFLVGITGIYIILINPFSLLFLIPVNFWFLINGRKGVGKFVDIFIFLLGELVVYALIYFFGYQILRYGIVFLWMFLNMFATGTVSFTALAVSTAVLSAGLMLVVAPPQER